MDKNTLEKIQRWCEDYCSENELFLVKVEQNGGKIEVFADSIENITIEQCGKLSRFLQNKLEEETDILTQYSLDVSSPGMSNPLILPIQYRKRLGKNISLTTTEGLTLEGIVKDVTDEGINIETTIPANKKKKQEEQIIQHKYNFNQIKKAIIPLPTNFKKK